MMYWEPSVQVTACRCRIFIFKQYDIIKIIVQGTVIYTYRLALHLRKILTKQLTAFVATFARVKRDCHPVDYNQVHQLQAMTFNTELLKILFLRNCGYF